MFQKVEELAFALKSFESEKTGAAKFFRTVTDFERHRPTESTFDNKGLLGLGTDRPKVGGTEEALG